MASPFLQRFFIVGVWGLRPQRVQGRALAFLLYSNPKSAAAALRRSAATSSERHANK
jgi:hypothetical protein